MTRQRAFTLVELLVVIAIIGILATITFGIASGVGERQMRAKAQAEVAALAAALDSYRLEHGSYPNADGTNWDGNGGTLFLALTGQQGPDGTAFDSPGKSFVDISDFVLRDPEEGSEISGDNVFVDPWGSPYVYQFAPGGGWNRFGFVLLSMGPDQELGAIQNGIVDNTDPLNADNLTQGE